jgi:putative membrane protein
MGPTEQPEQSGTVSPPNTKPAKSSENTPIAWLFRFIKGMFIGTGAILPGVSGGALAAVFGLYERMIAFLADVRKDFWRNVLFFTPVAVGALFGMFVLAFPLDYGLVHFQVQVVFFFIGAIAGTFPALYAEAGKRGRSNKHLVIMVVVAAVALTGLALARAYLNVDVPLNFGTWMMAGAIFVLGMIVPGLSPSNFLLYFNMYQPMTDGIKRLDFSILVPCGIGAVLCVLAFAKAMAKLLEIAYPGVFHFILGVVIASTAIIIPLGSQWDGVGALGIVAAVVCLAAGVALGLWMTWLEKRYKGDDD